MMKKILIALLVLAVIGGAVGYYMFSKGHDETAGMKPSFTVTSDTIVKEFLDDEAAASAKYINEVIQVSGPLFEVNKTDGKITGVKLSSDEFYIVNCTFQNPIDELSGEQVTVKGVCSGFIGDKESMLPGGTVELKRSVIVQ